MLCGFTTEQHFNKAGYTATPVACRLAGAVFEVTWLFGQEQWGQKKSKVWWTNEPTNGPMDRWTNGPTKRIVSRSTRPKKQERERKTRPDTRQVSRGQMGRSCNSIIARNSKKFVTDRPTDLPTYWPTDLPTYRPRLKTKETKEREKHEWMTGRTKSQIWLASSQLASGWTEEEC